MQIYSNSKAVIDACTSKRSFSIAHLYTEERPLAMHIHDIYEFFYCIRGGKQFLIDYRFDTMHPGDVFLINKDEEH